MASKYAKVETKDYTWPKVLFQWILVYIFFIPFFKIVYKAKIIGRENIPKDRSFIVAANHMSYLDPVVLSMAIRRPVAYMAKEELFHVPILSPLIQALGAFAVNRQNLEIATIKSAKNVVATKKWILCIFPQGTRVKPGRIQRIGQGFAYLSKATKAEILPVAIMGSDKYHFLPFSGNLTIKIGKPLPACTDMEETMDQWGQAIAELTGYEYDKEECLAEYHKKSTSEV